jgi:hypothetical protein
MIFLPWRLRDVSVNEEGCDGIAIYALKDLIVISKLRTIVSKEQIIKILKAAW